MVYVDRKDIIVGLKCATCGSHLVGISSRRIRYDEGDIPSTLITYLHESSTFCPCGKLCVEDGIHSIGSINLLRVSDSICGEKIVPIDLTLCSTSCFERFSMKVIL